MQKFFLLITFLFSFHFANCSHLVGGEMTYKYLGGINYEISIVYYRDCRTPEQGGGHPQAIANDEPLFLTLLNSNGDVIKSDELTVSNAQILNYTPSSNCGINLPQLCFSKIVFKTTLSLSFGQNYTLVNSRCCWNNSIENIQNSQEIGQTLFLNINTSIENSSAVFNSTPNLLSCVNQDEVLDFSASDNDGDSLSYSLCTVYGVNGLQNPKPQISFLSTILPLPYLFPATSSTPIPNSFFQLNKKTGQINMNSSNQGTYLIGVCCHEWRNGVEINISRRNTVLKILNCDYKAKATIACDSVAKYFSDNKYCISSCNTSNKTIKFKNKSVGAWKYHWDFGVSGSLVDTSNLAEPSFTFPANGDYEIKLTAFGTNCVDSDKVLVHIADNEDFTASFTYNGKLCVGNEILFSGAISPSNAMPVWSIVNDKQLFIHQNLQFPFIFSTPGEKDVVLYAGNNLGCYSSHLQTLNITSLNVKTNDDIICSQGSYIQINTTGAINYSWDKSMNYNFISELSDYNIPNPILHTYSYGTNTFVVTGIDNDGCVGKDTLNVASHEQDGYFIPNVFTPNGDGNNDFLKVFLISYDLEFLKIYNRRGQCVFTTNSILNTWDGKLNGSDLATDVYYWQMKMKSQNDGSFKLVKGDVLLMR